MAAARDGTDRRRARDRDQRRGRGAGASAAGSARAADRREADRARGRRASGRFETGTPTAIAAASGRLQDAEREATIGTITVVDDDRGGLRARGAAAARGPGSRRPRRRGAGDDDARRWRTSELPAQAGADVTVGGTDYRVVAVHGRRAGRPGDDREPVRACIEPRARARWCAVVGVDDRLPRARVRLRGDREPHALQRGPAAPARRPAARARATSRVTVPAEGNDEFAALGKEFNSMARQLEARLDDLRTRARPPAGGDPARRRVVRARPRPRRRARDRRADRGRRRRRRLWPRDDAPARRRADGGGRPDRRPERVPPRAARRRGGGDGRRRGGGDQHRRDERAGRAAVRHRGRRPRARDRLRRARRPPASRRRSASCSPTSPAKPQSPWKTSICTRPCSARRSPTS